MDSAQMHGAKTGNTQPYSHRCAVSHAAFGVHCMCYVACVLYWHYVSGYSFILLGLG